MSQNSLLETIIEIEWTMFDKVQNIGQRAPCQDDSATFRIMRHSQLSTWSPDVLQSYWTDLQAASIRGINLLERKYAYMMRDSEPAYYAAQLEPYLPKIPSDQELLIARIVKVYAAWHQQARTRFPRFAACGRPAAEDSTGRETSTDAYLKGELRSYSKETRVLLLRMVTEAQAAGRNLVEENYENIAWLYGYQSLAEAEEALCQREAAAHE